MKTNLPLRSIVIAPGRVEPVDQRAIEPSAESPGRWLVLATLFLVTGALGLPLLWRCPDLSRPERWFWAIVVTLYTAALIVAVGLVVRWSSNSLVGG